MGSRFQVVEQGPPIEVFQLNKLCTEDTFKNKVNLGVGGKFLLYYMYYINAQKFHTCSLLSVIYYVRYLHKNKKPAK